MTPGRAERGSNRVTYWQSPHPHAPPPAYSPPVRKRLIWPWILGLVVFVLLAIPFGIAGGSYVMNMTHDKREVPVTIEVTGTAATARVEVDEGSDTEPKTMQVSIPWRTEFTVAGTDKNVSVIGWPDSEVNSLTCRIIANGKVIAEDTIGGPLARCSGDGNGLYESATTTSSKPSTPTGPPPQSDLMPGLTLPVGSTAQNSTRPTTERWDAPTPYADMVQILRTQLPVRSDYHGLPFCFEGNEHDLTIWGWGTKADFVSVSVEPSGLTTGSEIAISREPYSEACGG